LAILEYWRMTDRLPTRDVIVLLPGIMGSVLERDGDEVWAPAPGAAWRALRSLGRSVRELRLEDDPVDQDVLADGVVATRLVETLHIIPGVWSIDGYTGVRQMILEQFDVVPGQTYIEFPYDWRRDNRVAARRLAETAERVLRTARETEPDAKLVLVGHSMGGLVARYYLECLDGWKDTRRLVTFGTPYRGSLNALDFLANGFVKKIGPLTIANLTALLQSFTSVYQLLPIYECVDEGGERPVRPAEATRVPSLDVVRASGALSDFHRAIETAVEKRPEHAYEIHPVVGITQPTSQSARVAGTKLEILRTRRNKDGQDVDESGDGTVPRVSATPIELGSNPSSVYASQKHASLQNADNVLTQLLGVLTQVGDLAQIREARDGIALDMDDAFAAGEPVELRAETTQPRLTLEAHVVDVATGATAGPYPLAERDERVHVAELPPLAPGDYRITVNGAGLAERLVQPVTSVFVCAPEDPDAEA
jgi:pimeloyl-ACP methyl ester carboxylesterase